MVYVVVYRVCVAVRYCECFVFLQSLLSKVREELVSLYYGSFLLLRYFAVIWFYFLFHGIVSFRRCEPWVPPPPKVQFPPKMFGIIIINFIHTYAMLHERF